MAKFIFLFILAFTAYVCAYPSQQNQRGLSPPSRVPRAAYPHNPDDHHHHDGHHHHNDHHEHVTVQRHYDPHNPGFYHEHVIVETHEDDHHAHPHDNEEHYHPHGREEHYHPHGREEHHHPHGLKEHYHPHGREEYYHPHGREEYYHPHGREEYYHPHGREEYLHGQLHRDGHDHAHQQPGYDEVYVYIDVPETHSKNSQASVIEAALTQVEDDADLRRVISDIISSELQDQKTPKYRYPQVVVDNKSPFDPDPTLSPEFIRRK